MKRYIFSSGFFLILSILIPRFSLAQSTGYKNPDQVLSWIKQSEAKHPGVLTSINIASSPGNRPLQLIRIGKEAENDMPSRPSVFVGANFEGDRPLATEGAIFLAELILAEASHYDSLN